MRKARSGLRSTEGVRDDPLDDPFVRDLKADVETETIPLLEQMDSADPSEREEVRGLCFFPFSCFCSFLLFHRRVRCLSRQSC